MTARRTLLMVSPVIPSLSGNGLAMRAAMTMRALAHYYQVTLFVVPQYFSPAGRSLPAELAGICDEVIIERSTFGRRFQTSHSQTNKLLRQNFDVSHLFRLASIPAAQPWLSTSGEIHLDFDDVESVSRPRIAALYRNCGRLEEAEAEELAARGAMDAEIDALMRFDRTYVCSEGDSDRLPFCGNAQVRILPNVVDLPKDATASPVGASLFTFLFVGTLGYFPNEEGLRFFAREVLPIVRDLASNPFRVQIVGHGHAGSLDDLRRVEEIEFVGAVKDIAPWYTAADAVVAPVRAGGGSRIKVLEAFAYRRPVVSTSIGLEGIAGQHNVHALVADDPPDFAGACVALMNDETLRRRLAAQAFQLVGSSYTLDAMIEAVTPDR